MLPLASTACYRNPSLTFFVASVHAADTTPTERNPAAALGRLDYASLSQQSLMELLVEHIESKEDIWQSSEIPDISEWEDVELNENGEVVTIMWEDRCLEGTIALQWLPPTVIKCNTSFNAFEGSVDTWLFPQKLEEMRQDQNNLSGELILSELPETLRSLDFGRNNLTGSLDLTSLPSNMVDLYLYDNHFEGTVCLTKLPQKLEALSIYGNSLSGTVDLTALPKSLADLFIGSNKFFGETDFSMLPVTLRHLNVSLTKLSGVIPPKARMHIINIDIEDSKVKMMMQW